MQVKRKRLSPALSLHYDLVLFIVFLLFYVYEDILYNFYV